MIIPAQLCGDITSHLQIVVNNQNVIFRCGGSGPAQLYNFLLFIHLLRLEVSIAQWQADGENSALAISAVLSLNRTMMHGNNHLTEVQANACTINVHSTGIASLIESVENMFQAIFVDTHAIIRNGKFQHLWTTSFLLMIQAL